MEEPKFTQHNLALKLKISDSHLSNILDGKRKMPWFVAKELSVHLGKDSKWWMDAPPVQKKFRVLLYVFNRNNPDEDENS